MSVTKDGDTGRWMSQIRVTDWTGKTIHKKKRGFATKKEALQWERDSGLFEKPRITPLRRGCQPPGTHTPPYHRLEQHGQAPEA